MAMETTTSLQEHEELLLGLALLISLSSTSRKTNVRICGSKDDSSNLEVVYSAAVGKSSTRAGNLPGTNVSRGHCEAATALLTKAQPHMHLIGRKN